MINDYRKNLKNFHTLDSIAITELESAQFLHVSAGPLNSVRQS